MSSTHPRVPLGHIAGIRLGKMLKAALSSPDDVSQPYLRAAHVQPQGRLDFDVSGKTMWFSPGEVAGLDLRRSDVVVVEGGAGYGRSAFLSEDLPGWGFQNSIIRVREEPGLSDGKFIYYCLQSALDIGEIEVVVDAATFAHFTSEKVSRFRIPLPPHPTQRAIADYLDRETAEIDAMAAELDGLVRLLGERSAELEGEEFARAIRDFPSVPVEHLAEVFVGIVIKPSQYYVETGGAPALRGMNIKKGYVDTSNLVHISEEGNQSNQRSILRQNDVATIRTGNVGISSVIPEEMIGGNAIDLIITRPSPRLEPSYLVAFLNSPAAKDEMDQFSVGTIQSHFNVGSLQALRLPLPDLEEQCRIVEHLDEVTSEIDSMIADAQELKTLLAERRSAIITEVVTGRKEVPVA